jgi:hypothetical protein
MDRQAATDYCGGWRDGHNGATQHPGGDFNRALAAATIRSAPSGVRRNSDGDNNASTKNMILLHAPSVAERVTTHRPQEQARDTRHQEQPTRDGDRFEGNQARHGARSDGACVRVDDVPQGRRS